MKRVFAFISLFAIALVMFGFATSDVKAAAEPADGKWFENPTLLTDDEGNVVEIPMYIMNSVMTTFPDFFDYEGAKGTEFEDKSWEGSTRQYPWNGVKVLIPQFDENGATGKVYGLYPYGAGSNTVAVGQNIYTTKGTWHLGSYINKTAATNPGLSSLSFYLFNVLDEAWPMKDIEKANKTDPYIIFDAEGKAVAGMVFPGDNNTMDSEGLGEEFCWDENGVGVVANADGSNCRREKVESDQPDLENPVLDENGEQVLDEEGNPQYYPLMVDGENPDFVKYRFVWQYMEEKPANLNNGYLNDGWKASNWDFYNEETKVAVCILGTSTAYGGVVSSAESAADESVAADYIRAPFNDIEIPAGGLLYKLGYLDRGTALLSTFKEVQAQAYLYGRNEAYSQYVKCYNYAVRDIKFIEKALDGLGYSFIEGTNTVEVVAGTKIDFDKLIDLAGVSYCFTDENDIFSFQNAVLSDAKEKELFDAKYAEFLAAAIEEIKVSEDYSEAYGDYKEWLDKQLEKEAQLKAAVEKAQAELDAAKANTDNIIATAEQSLANSTDKATKDAYQLKLDAITAAKKAIEDKKADIVKKEAAITNAEDALAKFEELVRTSPEYLGYKQALDYAYNNFKKTLKTVYSYVALELGSDNTKITMADLKYTAEQSEEEDWVIKFANAALAQGYAKVVAAVEEEYANDGERTAAIDAAAEEFKAAFCVEAGNEFATKYEEKVENFVSTVTNLAIANKAISDYITISNTQRDLYEKGIKDAEAAYKAAVDELGEPANEEEGTPATGLFLKLEEAEQAKEDWVVETIKNEKTYKDAIAAEAAAQTKLDEAKAALGAPSTDTTPATGFYVAYEAEAKDMNAILENLAKPFADEDFEDWKNNVYYDQMSLEYTISVNGKMEVFKPEFRSKKEFVDTFLKEFYEWCTTTKTADDKAYLVDGTKVTLEQFMHSDAEAEDYEGVYKGLAGASTFVPYLNENKERWAAAINLWNEIMGVGDVLAPASPWTAYTVKFYAYVKADAKYAGTVRYTPEQHAKFPLPTDYYDYVLEMSNNLNEKTDVVVTVKNPILDKESTLDLDFVVIDSPYDATPIIEINDEALIYSNYDEVNVKAIANAYDRVYSEATGLKGNDISSQINYVCPELTAAIESGVPFYGKFPVTLTVVNATARKEVTKTVVVTVKDTVAPALQVRDVTLNYGEDFHYLDGVIFAYDNVDGNLFDYSKYMFDAEESVNTLVPGEYNVTVSVMDASGNSAEATYVVYVNEQEVDLEPVFDAIEKLESAVEDTEAALSDKVDGAQDAIENVESNLGSEIDNVEAIASDNTLVVVATVLAGVAALASVGAVVLVVLKKK